jgi:hypothetical protein
MSLNHKGGRRKVCQIHAVQLWNSDTRVANSKPQYLHVINILSYIFSLIDSSMAVQTFVGSWPLLQFRNLSYTDRRTSGRAINPLQGRYLHRGQHKHRVNAHTDIHVLRGIRTHDPAVRASEDGQCNRHYLIFKFKLLAYMEKVYSCITSIANKYSCGSTQQQIWM